MLEKFTYTNHLNEVVEFGKGSLFVNENDLRDFDWDITSKNDRISGFKKGIVSKTIPIILKCDSESEGIELRNRIFEVFEKYVLAKKHGKIHIGDYYLRCYITGSKKTQYLINHNYMLVTLTVQTDHPAWVKETTTMHGMVADTEQDYLDYSYDFQHDFKNSAIATTIINEYFIPCDFIMTIYGAVVNPTIYIGNHRYFVNVTVGVDDYLTINSADKTVVLNRADGKKENYFNMRDRDSYIFEKIPSGTSDVTATNAQFRFDLTLLEERGEPKWT